MSNQQRYASGYVLRSPRPSRLLWDTKEYKWVAIDGEKLVLDDARNGLKQLLKETWDAIRLLCGTDQLLDDLPETLIDHHTIKALDYSFLEHVPCHLHKMLTLIARQRSKQGLAPFSHIDGDGNHVYNHPVLRMILALTGKINMNISILIFVLATISTRVTEHLQSTFRNSIGRQRTLFAYNNALILIKLYSKMTNSVGVDLCQPVIPPKLVSDIMKAFFAGGIRDVEEAFVEELNGIKARVEYHT